MRNAIIGLGLSGLVGCSNFSVPQIPDYDPDGQIIEVVIAHEWVYIEIDSLPGENSNKKVKVRSHAKAKYVDGVPTVFLDLEMMEKFSDEGKDFILYHEIGHFKRGHFIKNLTSTQEEKEADCYSGKYLRNKFNYSNSQMEKILDDVRINLSFNRYQDLKRCLEIQ
jgi:hypothetical protein